MRGSARSQDGSVSIVTDVGGRITDLWIADWAMEQHGPQRLAELIMDRHRVALDSAHSAALRAFDNTEGSGGASL